MRRYRRRQRDRVSYELQRVIMRTALVALRLLCAPVMGGQCSTGDGVSVTGTDETAGLSVVEVDGGIEVTSASEIAIVAFVESPEGEQECELDLGKRIAVASIIEAVLVGDG